MVDRSTPSNEPRRTLLPIEHTAFEGTPFYDEELQVPHREPHRIMVYETGSILDVVAKECGLRFLSDEPIWYFDPRTGVQKVFYADWAFSEVDPTRVTAHDLRLVVEVVTTTSREKEIKDTKTQKDLHEYNCVPEFALIFPDATDPRALHWYTLKGSKYQEHIVPPGGEVAVGAMPGLVLRVRPQSAWTDGRKLDVFFRGEFRPPLEGERERAETERRRADEENTRAEREKERAEKEKERAEKEKERAEREQRRAQQSNQHLERMATKLRELGIDPDSL